ncbi:MAG: hypothetical protein JRI25_02935 [Deltaproteobacteria bacterium]|nr:hypothetical protein [Deltaproteobacteria bacterium]
MEHTLNAARAPSFPAPDVEVHSWVSPWTHLVPLWRHAAWMALLFAVCAASVSTRIEVQALHKDLSRNARLQREAVVLHERLELEWSVRRRTVAIEAVADQMALSSAVPLVAVEARP